jgi:hypothetical protein
VGTEGSALKRTFGGAPVGDSSRTSSSFYRELSRVYDDGDRIFLFGFSRGAFTVRTVAGMIGSCGILKGESFDTARELRRAVDAVYVAYRARYSSTLTRVADGLIGRPSGQEAIDRFRDTFKNHLNEGFTIAFIGVWDTVDAVGLPFALSRPRQSLRVSVQVPDERARGHIERACHALSIDDPRVPSGLCSGTARTIACSRCGSQAFIRTSAVGIRNRACRWLRSIGCCRTRPGKAADAAVDHELFRGHASVDDTLYDPRSGLGLFYRWMPRDIRAHCKTALRDAANSPHGRRADRARHRRLRARQHSPDVTVVRLPWERTIRITWRRIGS